MTAQDRTEVREMLNDIISAPLEKIEGQYRLMTNQLSNIEIQTLKTNGRVKVLETETEAIKKDIFEHPVNCSKGKDIDAIKKFVDQKKFIKTEKQHIFENVLKVLGVVIALGMLLVTLNKLNEKADKVLTGQENLGMPFPITKSRGEPALFSDSLSLKYWPKDSSYVFIIKKVKSE